MEMPDQRNILHNGGNKIFAVQLMRNIHGNIRGGFGPLSPING